MSFTLLFSLSFSVALMVLTPILVQPDQFLSLLNGRQKFILETHHGNLLGKDKIISFLSEEPE